MNIIRLCALSVCLGAVESAPAEGVFTTVAGTDWLFPGDGRPAANVPLGGTLSMDLAFDRNGSLFVAVFEDAMVLRVGRDGIISIYAGNGLTTRSRDGILAVNGSLFTPTAIAVDSSGSIYVAANGGVIRKVTSDGIITAFAGNGQIGYSGDGGPALQAQFSRSINGLAFDSGGNLYVSDGDNNCIRRISTSGLVTTIAGTGRSGFSGDGGAADSAKLSSPLRIFIDASDNLYIADLENYRIRKVANGIITTVAGGDFCFSDAI